MSVIFFDPWFDGLLKGGEYPQFVIYFVDGLLDFQSFQLGFIARQCSFSPLDAPV
jgi:hypothetical protein